MSERVDVVGARHQFHDAEYAQSWADRFKVTEERLSCFEHLGDLIEPELSKSSTILELGTGPGYLAAYLLDRFTCARYLCLDYSAAMREIAGRPLEAHRARVSFLEADLIHPSWDVVVPEKCAVVVSTWALHDLGSKTAVESVYLAASRVLTTRGLLLNADFVKPTDCHVEFEGGRFLIAEHLESLRRAGYVDVACTREFAVNLSAPMSHHNYACLKARWV